MDTITFCRFRALRYIDSGTVHHGQINTCRSGKQDLQITKLTFLLEFQENI